MTARLEVDLTYALDRTLGSGRGLTLARFEDAVSRCTDLEPWVAAEPQRHALLELTRDKAPADAARAWAEAAPPARDVVVVGIGGSALSARVFDAIAPAGSDKPRLHVLDTVDPRPLQTLLRALDPGATCLIGISKSGTTLETMARPPSISNS